MRPLCNLQVCHLVAYFYSASSKGLFWYQVQDGGALLSVRLIKEDAALIPSEDPTLAACVIEAEQTDSSRLHLFLCLRTWACSMSVSALRLLQFPH